MLSDGWVPGQAGCIPPPPRAMGCNRNRPDINTTTVGGRGGGLGDCVYRLSLPRHGGPEGGGGFGKWTSVTPRGRKPIFPHPRRTDPEWTNYGGASGAVFVDEL